MEKCQMFRHETFYYLMNKMSSVQIWWQQHINLFFLKDITSFELKQKVLIYGSTGIRGVFSPSKIGSLYYLKDTSPERYIQALEQHIHLEVVFFKEGLEYFSKTIKHSILQLS